MSQPLTLRTETGDEHLDLLEFEARVRKGEVSPQSLVRLPAVTGESFVAAAELELFRSLHEPKRAHFARAFSLTRFPFITSGIILLHLSVFLYTARNGPLDLDEMVRFGAKAGPLILDLGQLWRLFTANFLHRDALHIGLNMFVLFNVGGVLENTYRTLDYLWLLVFTGIATMTTSLFLSDAVSLGASGMVYGCLGGVVVLGIKYRTLLPSRYRRVLGEAAIPTVLGLFLIGVTSKGVDNWAHVGGLLAGVTTATFMKPRLLTEVKRWWDPALRALPSLTVLLVVFFGQPLFGAWLPRMHVEHSDEYGISVPVPKGWTYGADPLGTLSWFNGLPGAGRANFAAEAEEVGEGLGAEEVQAYAKRFADERLDPRVLGPDVMRVISDPPVPVRIFDRDALKLSAHYDKPNGTTMLEAYFVPRGALIYQLVFTWPEDFPRYRRVAEQMAFGVHFDEVKSLRQARAQALLFPNSDAALAQLGTALRLQGEPLQAADVLTAAVKAEPASARYRRELALSWLQAGDIERACEASGAAVLYAPEDPQALEVDARCELARGHLERALERLQAARVLAPRDERLRAAEQKLSSEVSKLR